jgi:hypothetical protein
LKYRVVTALALDPTAVRHLGYDARVLTAEARHGGGAMARFDDGA